MAYVIRRYANRKLYDVQASRYVTLEDLEKMVRAGKEIAVVDAETGDDLTPVILTQILLESERDRRAALPTAFLHQLIKHGASWQEFMAKGFQATLEGIVTSQRETERIFQAWAHMAGLSPAREQAAARAASEEPGPGREKPRKRKPKRKRRR